MSILIIDGMNFLHRARSGFSLGDHSVVFNAFRNLRSLLETHKSTRVYFCLEGKARKKYELLPTYKANRKIDKNAELSEKDERKLEEMARFFRQVDDIVDLLSKNFPISVVRHPDYECDDVVYNIIRRSSSAIQFTVVSNDSDFTQLLNEFDNVRIYNPMTKTYVSCPDYCYVTWKSLRGDGSDNIPGLSGVGDKTAEKIVNDPDQLRSLLSDAKNAEIFERNYSLIKFETWDDDVAMKMTTSTPSRDWDSVRRKFEEYEFKSITKDVAWDKFLATFDSLWLVGPTNQENFQL